MRTYLHVGEQTLANACHAAELLLQHAGADMGVVAGLLLGVVQVDDGATENKVRRYARVGTWTSPWQ